MKTKTNLKISHKGEYAVHIIESERGWGQRLDETKYFKSLKDAEAFVKGYNSLNDKPDVPDWYMYAQEPILVS